LAALLGTAVSAPESEAESMSENAVHSLIFAAEQRVDDCKEMSLPLAMWESISTGIATHRMSIAISRPHIHPTHEVLRSPATVELSDVQGFDQVSAIFPDARVID
jgi:hypothetical protein